MFVNNAYNNFDDSQLQLLMDVYNTWQGTDKIIVNVSSRYTNGLEKYCKDKEHNNNNKSQLYNFIQSIHYTNSSTFKCFIFCNNSCNAKHSKSLNYM